MISAIEKNSFNLVSFNSDNIPPIKIDGAISRLNNELKIKYVLTGNLSAVITPQVNKTPLRRYDLWEHTCFEFFLKIKDTAKYWEFNLALSKNWNVFRFLDYRLNISEEEAFNALPFIVCRDAESLIVEANIDLNKIVGVDEGLAVAISTVIENCDRQLSYWALTHPQNEADFHHQESFLIEI